MLVLSLFGNLYLFNALYTSNKYIDFINDDHFNKYVNQFQQLTNNMEKVIEDFENEENYLWMVSNSEYLRLNGGLPSNEMSELSRSFILLGQQVNNTVTKYFYRNEGQILSQEQQEYLSEFNKNLQSVSNKFNEKYELFRTTNTTLKDEHRELAHFIENIVERNEEILLQIPPID
ncbi:hypothetical protein [Anaerobacillus arseniciselenatis]|nr:hypothetical protein [Anaerobacillus arseniciselenatis]